ncbi:MAG: Maf family protein [Bacteroidales bacterium]|nr:Maf family protein [Bacteroidales bacterium]
MLLDELKNYKIYLASKSPRRRELLSDMGIGYELLSTDVEEHFDPALPPAEVVQYLSKLKLSTIDMSRYPANTIFIACDTIVVVDGKIIGKPKDSGEALSMLRQLSGHTHAVLSGLTVATPARMLTDYRTTDVTFAELPDGELRYYVEHYRPLDKAGAYGVQEWIGCVGIKSITGSFYNVMGLPTRLLWEMLAKIIDCGDAIHGVSTA